MSTVQIKTNPLNYITLGWLTPLLLKGRKTPLADGDLYELADYDKSDAILVKFQVFWDNLTKHRESPATVKPPNFFWTLLSILMWPLLGVAVSATASVFLGLYTPKALQQLLNYVDPTFTGSYWVDNGIALAFIVFGFQAFEALFGNLQQTIFRRVVQIAHSIVIGAIYEKSLKLSAKSKIQFNEGKILNMVNQDAGNVVTVLFFLPFIILLPLQIILSIYFLAELVGKSIWSGIGVFVGIGVIALATSPFAAKGFTGWFTGADKRIGILREMLYGIKIVKFQAMEDFFRKKIDDARKAQIESIRLVAIVLGGVQGLADIAPTIISVAIFAVYASYGNTMSPAIIFPALNYISGIVEPINTIQELISNVITGKVSFERIGEFLIAEEYEPKDSKLSETVDLSKPAIVLNNVTWRWEDANKEREKESKKKDDEKKDSDEASTTSSEAFHMKEINLEIKRGKLIGVVGSIGSGKSSLFSGLIGESVHIGGEYSINGKIAYCAQIPWILTGSIEKNILLNLPLNQSKLDRVVAVSGLESDLKMLADGIKTEIGENGVNLSGGQKARVSLARSLYADADIYLLDDPIAALDAQVGRLVFSKAIKEYLGDKTVLLATHQLHYLQEVDEIIVLEQGNMVEFGTFTELNNKKDGILSKMLEAYRFDKEVEKKDEKEKEKEKKKEEIEKGEEFITEEEKNDGGIKFEVYWTYLKNLSLSMISVLAVLYILSLGIQIFLPIWLSKWTQDSTGDTNNYLRIYTIFGGIYAVANTSLFWALIFMSIYASIRYHDGAMESLYHAPMDFFDRNPIGRIINRMSADVQSLDIGVISVLLSTLLSFTQVLVAVVMVCQASYYLIFAFVGMAIVFYLIFAVYQPNNRELKRINSNRRSPLDSHITESLAGTSTIVAYNVQGDFIAKQRALTDKYTASNYIFRSAGVWFAWRISMLSSVITLILAIIGGYSKNFSVSLAASIGLGLSFASRMSASINFFLTSVGNIESELNSVERLHHYRFKLASEAAFTTDKDPRPEQWPTKGELKVSGLELRYPARPDYPVIKNLSFTVKPGEKIGVVGRTGSGKSTLVSAFFRIIEASKGQILIDDQDISKIGLNTLRSRLQMIPQEPILFEGTFRSNLDYTGTFDDEELWKVLEYAGLKSFVGDFEDKLDAKVTLNGENLSVGQRQLICLARAILKKPKFMVMDEATSSVDGDSDELIQKAIKEHFAETTIISIAHRLNTIAEFDRVLVLDQGVLKEFDAPHILLNTPGSIFSELADASGPANSQLLRELAKNYYYSK
ncbi:Multidrug resistance-associated protein 1 [Boothiomyces macroporosus]|uniref:Multidrug resistance-associated protein 1 n=1 Tax=Boothiomyces macroporosus TaxID=261099 RepID=A0AAD5Y5V7_9FUNG|nr:Multidrug resistance-associated protein 1 [Boothiomyces macroporosus]